MLIDGRFFDPQASLASPARLRMAAAGVVLEVDGRPPAPLPVVASISEPVGNVPRKIHFADGSLFEAPAEADLSRLVRGGNLFGFINRFEQTAAFVGLAGVATILIVLALFRWGLPAAAHGLALVTPQPVIEAIDVLTRKSIDSTLAQPSGLSQDRREALRAGFVQLAGRSSLSQPPELLFRIVPAIGPNALALPGGSVLLTDALVALARSDDEILGVLAHELGHVEGRHGLRQAYAAAGFIVAAGMVAGDPGGLIQAVAGQAATLQSLSYSRDFERDADRRSVEIMMAAGRDPTAWIGLINRIEAEKPGRQTPSLLSTHPDSGDRANDVKALARELGWKG